MARFAPITRYADAVRPQENSFPRLGRKLSSPDWLHRLSRTDDRGTSPVIGRADGAEPPQSQAGAVLGGDLFSSRG